MVFLVISLWDMIFRSQPDLPIISFHKMILTSGRDIGEKPSRYLKITKVHFLLQKLHNSCFSSLFC